MVASNSSSIWLAKSREPLFNAILAALGELASSRKTGLADFVGRARGRQDFVIDRSKNTSRASNLNVVARRWNLKQHTLDDIRNKISNCINVGESNQPLAVLLDNFDLLLRNDPDGSDFFAIEREVILPAVERGSCLFIITSQIELTQWREDEVRQCQQSFLIPSLSRQETNTLIQKRGLDSKNVYDLTFGHPKAIDWLWKEPELGDEAISAKAFDYFLEGLAPDIQQLTRQVCLMPLFNPFLLRSVSSQGDSDTSILYLKHLDQIRELIGVGLVYWDISVGAYRFRDNAVRRLLARGVRLRDPKLFQDVNEIANEYYQAEARSAGYLHRHLVSAVYHLANTQLADDDMTLEQPA